MIFGQTDAQRNATYQEQCRAKINGTKAFALLPVRLTDGRYVWLSNYYYYPFYFMDKTGNITLYDYGCRFIDQSHQHTYNTRLDTPPTERETLDVDCELD